jgi:hypothetical protein
MGIGIFGFLLFLFITVVCLIPFAIAVFYLALGINSLLRGRKEKSRVKTMSGYNTIFISSLAVLAIYFLWQWLCRGLFSR